VVADLGAGTGFFTRSLAIAVGDSGSVYAVDIEQSMLDYIRSRDDVMQNRVIPVLAAPDDPKLPDGTIDIVLTVNTWHHIKKRSAYLKLLDRALTPDGRVVVVDFRGGELPVGPPPGHKLSRAKVLKEFEKAGWKFAAESIALPYQYMLTFYPPRESGELDLFPDSGSDGPRSGVAEDLGAKDAQLAADPAVPR
jgi:ubiquinone/menaquinone biosynthesis C-methylase UbiE